MSNCMLKLGGIYLKRKQNKYLVNDISTFVSLNTIMWGFFYFNKGKESTINRDINVITFSVSF